MDVHAGRGDDRPAVGVADQDDRAVQARYSGLRARGLQAGQRVALWLWLALALAQQGAEQLIEAGEADLVPRSDECCQVSAFWIHHVNFRIS